MTSDIKNPVVGYVGLGAMGGAIARRLMLSRPLHVFDLNPAAREAFAAQGATVAPDLASLGRACDVVMICVPRSANVRQALFEAGGLVQGMAAGKVVIDQTSGDPAETRRMAEELAAHGIRLVDAPVSGGPKAADAGDIAIMTGGDAELLAELAPVLSQISPKVTRCGDVGAGQMMKLINNMISTCNRFAMLEGVTMGMKNGLDLAVMTEVLNQGGARSQVTDNFLRCLSEGRQSAFFALDLMLKDLDLAMGMGREAHVPLQFGQMARGMLQAASNTYGPGVNLDEIATYVASQAGVSFKRD